MEILTDVNLDEISISSDGRKITFHFLDMFHGKHLSTIICKSVYLFNYHNIFSEADGFACYVGEVTCDLIKEKDINNWLIRKKFGLISKIGANYVPVSFDLFYLHIESGEVVIDLLCEEIEKDGIKLKQKMS